MEKKKTINKKENLKNKKDNHIKKIKKDNKLSKKSIINKDNYLYYIFFILLIIVIILGINVYKVSREKDNKQANIVVPIYEKNTSNELEIDMEELSNKDEYSIKLANYRQDNINKEKIEYTMTIENESKAYIKVTKDEDKTNLITDQESTRIEGVSLKANEKDSSIYHFSIIDKKMVKKGEKIKIVIDTLQ